MDNRTDNVADGLRKVYTTIAQLKLVPDAHQEPAASFIDAIMNAIQKFLIQGAQSTIGGGAPGGQPGQPGGGMPGAGGPPGMAGMGAPPPPMAMAPGGGSGMVGLAPQQGNMDEMRRMLSQGSVNP